MVKKAVKRKQGRPPKPKGERRIASIRIALTEVEKREYERDAKAAGMSISDYGRMIWQESKNTTLGE